MRVTISVCSVMIVIAGCDQKQEEKPTAVEKPSNGAQTRSSIERVSEVGPTGNVVGFIRVSGQRSVSPAVVSPGDDVRDQEFCARDVIPDEGFLVDPDGGLANCFVYLRDSPDSVQASKDLEVYRQDQVSCRFVPRAGIVRLGQTVQFVNSDPIIHNTHVLGQANSSFNRILQANDQQGLEMTYQRRERIPVQVTCDMHPWMRAWHLPLDHPFAAVTDGDGSFRIEGLPVGQYRFRIWHERVGFLERSVELEIEAERDVRLDRVFPAERFTVE